MKTDGVTNNGSLKISAKCKNLLETVQIESTYFIGMSPVEKINKSKFGLFGLVVEKVVTIKQKLLLLKLLSFDMSTIRRLLI